MQAIPRFVSTDQQGSDEQEFLDAVDPSLVFLKGYQWPFDVGKVMCGSSIIDLLVQQESLKGRRVFLDYTRNPRNLDFTKLSPEAHENGFGKPIGCGEQYDSPIGVDAVQCHHFFVDGYQNGERGNHHVLESPVFITDFPAD